MTDDLRGKRVLVLGLGQYPKGSGISAALFAIRKGAVVRVTDQKNERDISTNVRRLKRFKNVTFRLGGHDPKDIRWADVIIRNPRVRPTSPEMKLAAKLGTRVESDISLFLAACPATVVGVTGTRGKSTTSTLVADMLKRSGRRAWLGGNILVSPLTFLDRVRRNDVVVLELSSWQLETVGSIGVSPPIACVTNVMRDHLNTYGSMDEYAESKAQIFRHQTSDGCVVLNMDDAYGKRWIAEAPGTVLRHSKRETKMSDGWLSGEGLMFRSGRKKIRLVERASLKAKGEHMERNMLAAALTAKAAGASLRAIRSSLLAFRGLPHRQEIVAVKRGITFVNDTTATTPDGTIAALRTFAPLHGTLRLILGGADKELEFAGLARELKRRRTDVALLPGTAHAKLASALRAARVRFEDAADLPDAFSRLLDRANTGDAVVLSPGCASFGLFANEFERGERFRALAQAVDVRRVRR